MHGMPRVDDCLHRQAHKSSRDFGLWAKFGREATYAPWGYLVGGYKGWANGYDHLLQENHALLVDRTQLRYGSDAIYCHWRSIYP